jgi:hypothetical protein
MLEDIERKIIANIIRVLGLLEGTTAPEITTIIINTSSSAITERLLLIIHSGPR